MKKLDFVFQALAFTVIGFLFLATLFDNEIIGLLYCGLFFIGLYHFFHYFFYLTYTYTKNGKSEDFMAWYLAMVIAYFILAGITFPYFPNEQYGLLLAAMAIAVGCYYFHEVHKKSFEFDIKVEV